MIILYAILILAFLPYILYGIILCAYGAAACVVMAVYAPFAAVKKICEAAYAGFVAIENGCGDE